MLSFLCQPIILAHNVSSKLLLVVQLLSICCLFYAMLSMSTYYFTSLHCLHSIPSNVHDVSCEPIALYYLVSPHIFHTRSHLCTLPLVMQYVCHMSTNSFLRERVYHNSIITDLCN